MDNIVFKYSDLVQNDGGLEKAKTDFIKLGDALIEKAKQVRKEAKFLNIENLDEFQKVEKKTMELVQVQKNYEQSLKKIDALEKKLATQRGRSAKAITAETEALKNQRKEARQIARIKNSQVGTIENLRARLALVTTAWTKLTEAELQNTKRGQRLNQSKLQLTQTLKRLESATGDNRRNVGAYSKALGGLRTRLVGVAQAAGVTLGLFGAFRVLRSSVNIVRDYEKANATLAGVLNKTKEETAALQEQSQQLGSTTVKTAQEATQAQTAYARLGFSLQEILDLTPATIDGSIALNSSLEDTATLVGAVVNSYDELSATDATQVIETLSAATTKSALDFEKLSTGLPIVLGAANALNVPLSEVTATLGKLSDAGIDTSTGATSLRNIFIESAKRGIDYKDALNQITNSTDKLSTANSIFGKRAAVSALVIANNTEGVAELSEELENAQVVQNLVKNELETLDGALKLLRSAWEGYILELNDASNGGNALARTIRFLAENLTTIFGVIKVGATTWVAYTVATKASTLATRVGIVTTRGMTVAQNLNTIATNVATVAQRTFNTAVKANPLGFLIALLAAAVTAYQTFKTSASEAIAEQERLNKIEQDARESGQAGTNSLISSINREFDAIKRQGALRKAQGESIEKVNADIAKSEQELAQEELKLSELRIQQLDSEVRTEQQLFDQQRKQRVEALMTQRGLSAREAGRVLQQEQRRINNLRLTNDVLIEEERKTQIKINDILVEKQNEREKIEAEFAEKRKNNAIKRAKELALLRRRLEDLQDEAISEDEAREIQQTRRKFQREIDAIKGNTDVEIALREELARARDRAVRDIEEKFAQQRIDALQKIENLEISYIKDETKRRIEQEKQRSEQIIKQINDNTVISEERRRELLEKETKKSNEAIRLITLEGGLKNIEENKKIAEAQLMFAREDFDNQEDYEKFKAKQLKTILLRSLVERLELLQDFGGQQFKTEIEQLKGQIAELSNDFNVEPSDDPFKKLANSARQVFSTVLNEMERLQRGTLNNINNAIQDQQKAIDRQQRLAEQGLTNTLAFEQKELAKREAEKIKQQKRLERIEKVKALYSTYNNYASDPNQEPGAALLKTLRDFTILEAIVASFGDGGITGIDGVEGVRTNSKGITQGRSHNMRKGVLAYHEGGEGFFSRKEVDNLGHDNFYKIKEIAGSGPMSRNFFTKQKAELVKTVQNNPYSENPSVVQGLNAVKSAIENKPVSEFNTPEVVNGVLKFIETIYTNNKKKRVHFKVTKNRI